MDRHPEFDLSVTDVAFLVVEMRLQDARAPLQPEMRDDLAQGRFGIRDEILISDEGQARATIVQHLPIVQRQPARRHIGRADEREHVPVDRSAPTDLLISRKLFVIGIWPVPMGADHNGEGIAGENESAALASVYPDAILEDQHRRLRDIPMGEERAVTIDAIGPPVEAKLLEELKVVGGVRLDDLVHDLDFGMSLQTALHQRLAGARETTHLVDGDLLHR